MHVIDCIQKSYDQVTYFVKVHGRWEALLEGAERLKLRMPVEVSPNIIGHDVILVM